ncbi:uncharacterized protein LOC105795885 [Gossypium raimondii]|uniref:uncharacterized protein LOC105795885 n=1 Tax=Gossypium raimondii TaxID=29730 RepID=UPI00227CC6F1|nr:uncharacterized protein LOC105795885 [Gossypium raimondii]
MDLLSVVHLLVLLMGGTNVRSVKLGPCNGSCIRYSLVKLLRLFGYDAVVCVSRWHHSGKVPGVVYVGSMTQFKQLPQLMVEDARSSLEQNSMMFPLWRPLAYLQAKCYSDTTSASILLLAISNANDI